VDIVTKMRCYFAHPEQYKNREDKYRIIEELESRRLIVLDPFEEEKEVLKKFGTGSYFEGETYELARAIWTKCLGLISSAQIMVAWIPIIDEEFLRKEPTYHTIGVGEEIAHAYNKRKFIQIISPIHHPSFAVYADQYFEDIDGWERMRKYKWRNKK